MSDKKLKNELLQFWEWAGMSPSMYASDRCSGEWETYYPGWDDLYMEVYNAIAMLSKGFKSEELADLILEAVAIDNECETICSYIEDTLSEDNFEFILKHATDHVQSEARWQIADLIGRAKFKEFEKYLDVFMEDKEKYTQRRALLSLARINPEKAEQVALKKLKDSDEYLRYVSLLILYEIESSLLNTALEILKNDTSTLIQKQINIILKS